MFSAVSVEIRTRKTHFGAEQGLPGLWSCLGTKTLPKGEKLQEERDMGPVIREAGEAGAGG